MEPAPNVNHILFKIHQTKQDVKDRNVGKMRLSKPMGTVQLVQIIIMRIPIKRLAYRILVLKINSFKPMVNVVSARFSLAKM